MTSWIMKQNKLSFLISERVDKFSKNILYLYTEKLWNKNEGN